MPSLSASFPPQEGARAFLRELLAEQQQLQTPAARAAQAFDAATAAPALRTEKFRELIPLSAPGPGEQYAFEVDLDSCSGCKSCVSACHALNGLDDEEAWRDTGLILGGTPAAPFQQTVTTACHHCADPGCLNGCPVLAYEKDPLTGIVRHLDDQCIGCQYCILKCPYDVPKYNARLGIVRKCDLCHQRLSDGEAPACVQSCPTQAIRIVHTQIFTTPPPSALDTAEPSTLASPDGCTLLFPGPNPAYTQPTTRYTTQRDLPGPLRAADITTPRVQPTHWPLVVMLTLIPWAIAWQAILLSPLAHRMPTWAAYGPALLGALGLAAATFHLGQPLRAWRVFLGLRQSWFSREAVLFGIWMSTTVLALVEPFVAPLAVLSGVAGLFCSVMIYVDTRRKHWRFSLTAPRFFLGGIALALAPLAPAIAAAVLVCKLASESRAAHSQDATALLLRGPLASHCAMRQLLAFTSLAALVISAADTPSFSFLPWVATALLLAGEISERALFFRAVDAPKMPGYPQFNRH